MALSSPLMKNLHELKDEFFLSVNKCVDAIAKLHVMYESLSVRLENLESKFELEKCRSDSLCTYNSSDRELIISGIPSNIKKEPKSISRKILNSIGYNNSNIITARNVMHKSQSLNKSINIPDVNRNNRSIIVTVASREVVNKTNKIIQYKRSYRKLKTNEIFETNESSSVININKMYSTIIYNLFLEVRRIAKLKGYLMPRIFNNFIFIKQSKNSYPISIKRSSDLEELMLDTGQASIC